MSISYAKRKKIFERDNFSCHYCGIKAHKIHDGKSPYSHAKVISLFLKDDWQPFEIDHKKPKSKGGTNHLNNLLTSCPICNLKKGTKAYKNFISEIANLKNNG